MLVVLAFVFFAGLFLGSFLNVVADRLAHQESFFFGRSHCDYCNHVLTWYELVPVVSFFLQGGKCRHCKKKLSWFYPISEIVTGISLALIVSAAIAQPLLLLILLILLTCCLLIVVFSDIKYEIIPLPIVIVIAVLAVCLHGLASPSDILLAILSGLGLGLFFLIIYLATRGKGMGMGDVIYALAMGMILGFPQVIIGVYIAFVSGAIIALFLVVFRKKKLHGGTIPFGPFLVVGTFSMMVWSTQLTQLATNFLLGKL